MICFFFLTGISPTHACQIQLLGNLFPVLFIIDLTLLSCSLLSVWVLSWILLGPTSPQLRYSETGSTVFTNLKKTHQDFPLKWCIGWFREQVLNHCVVWYDNILSQILGWTFLLQIPRFSSQFSIRFQPFRFWLGFLTPWRNYGFFLVIRRPSSSIAVITFDICYKVWLIVQVHDWHFGQHDLIYEHCVNRSCFILFLSTFHYSVLSWFSWSAGFRNSQKFHEFHEDAEARTRLCTI